MNKRLFFMDPVLFRANTFHMTTLEIGAYMRLATLYLMNGEPLPNDDKYLARRARLTSRQWSKARMAVTAMFDNGPGGNLVLRGGEYNIK